MRCIGKAGWHFGYVRRWNRKGLTSSMRTHHTAISRRRFAATAGGDVEPISRFFPSAGPRAKQYSFALERIPHVGHLRAPDQSTMTIRAVGSMREMARLHGFPDWFRFHATKWHGARQIGNSVPPPLARAITARRNRQNPGDPTGGGMQGPSIWETRSCSAWICPRPPRISAYPSQSVEETARAGQKNEDSMRWKQNGRPRCRSWARLRSRRDETLAKESDKSGTVRADYRAGIPKIQNKSSQRL